MSKYPNNDERITTLNPRKCAYQTKRIVKNNIAKLNNPNQE